MKITIPGCFRKKLDEPTSLDIFCKTIGQYMEKADFFPEYTRHGVSHINAVLEWAKQLIPASTLSNMSAVEMKVLLLSIVTHDIAMFLTNDGVLQLLKEPCCIDGDGKRIWHEEWTQYIKELFWLPRKNIANIFGKDFTINPNCSFDAFTTENDKKQCGEFLRRHHHELAQQIIFGGFWGNRKKDLFNSLKIEPEVRQIVALVVRSHCMGIREMECLIKQSFGNISRPYKNIRIYYLIAILRLSDILDAGESRAPIEFEDKQHFESKISQEEFSFNQSVAEKNIHHPRQVFEVTGHPESGKIYVKLERWLKLIQEELDASWAAMGDYYEDESDMAFTIRRVISNIWTEKAIFEKDYVTQPVSFRVNPDLPQLLIRPLYGDNPSYGIRELLQNSIDACREREYLEKKRNITVAYRGTVRVEIDTKSCGNNPIIRITDNGIGMDENIIVNYFLTSGASYKTSIEWLNSYSDDNCTPGIIRGGRFGIGVLAAFLLGNKVTIITRHINDSKGYRFVAEIDADHIEISRCDVADIGTSIEIISEKCNFTCSKICQFSEHGWKPVWWKWYHFKNPEVVYVYDGVRKEIADSELIPETTSDAINTNWFCLNRKNRDLLFFMPSAKKKQYFCNGISIEDGPYTMEKDDIEFKNICISFMDKHNVIEIDLARKSLIDFPQKNDYFKALFEHLIASWLVLPNHRVAIGSRPSDCSSSVINISRYLYGDAIPDLVISSHGYAIPALSFMLNRGTKSFLASITSTYERSKILNAISDINYPILLLSEGKKSTLVDSFFSFIRHQIWSKDKKLNIEWFRFKNSQEYLVGWNSLRSYFSDINSLFSYETDSDFVYVKGKHFVGSCQFQILKEESPQLIQYTYDFQRERGDADFRQLLKKYLPANGWIPFSEEQRESACPSAATKLLKKFNKSWQSKI